MTRRLVGITGSGQIGRDPFDRQCWSGSSYFFFTGVKDRGVLHRAFGVEVPTWQRCLYMARNLRLDRQAWREHFYMDRGYRDALTEEVRRHLEPGDFGHDFLQLGAMFNVPRLVDGRARCFSYHDGNLAEALRSPNAPRGIAARVIDRALAYEKDVYHGMAKVLSMSDYLRQSFLRDFDLPEARVVNIGAGINLESIPDPVSDKRYDSREVLFIGVDFARKGGWELLKAFRAVRGRLPDARLHIVGPRALKIPPDLEAGITYHGFLNKNQSEGRARLADLFRRCCLFAMPSLYEPFGIAPLEAMVHQLPCLVTGRWALAEMVVRGETGDLAECGNVDDIAERLAVLLANPEALARMGQSGRRRVLERYTWDQVVDRLVRVIAA
jgi:glycosyltransferase involved in cell wall biosynthesis